MSYEENEEVNEENKKLELIENFLQKVVFTKQLNDKTVISNEINTLTNDLNTQLKLNFSEKNNELVKQIIQKLTNPESVDNEIFDHINKLNQDSYTYKLLKKLTFYADNIEVHNQYSLRFLLTIVKPYRQTNFIIAEYSLYPQKFSLFYNDIAVGINEPLTEIMKSTLKFLKKIEDELITP